MKWRSFYNRFLIQTVTIIVYIFLKFQLQVKMTVQKILNLTDCLIWSLQKYNTAIISASPSRDHNINIVSVISMVGVTIHVTGYWRWWTKHDADQSYGYTSSSGWTRCKILGKPDKKWYKASSYWHCFFIIVQIKLAIVKIKTLKFFKIIFLWAIYMTSSCFEGIVYQSNDYDNYMLMINYILGLTGTLNVMLWRNSIFGLELSMLWAWLCLMMSLKQRKIQFKPRHLHTLLIWSWLILKYEWLIYSFI